MKRLFRFYPVLALLCMMLFISSCDLLHGVSSNANNPSVTTTATPIPIVSPTPIPPVSTNCPETGTARAAIMPPLPPGKHQGVLYISNQTSGNNYIGTLSRYDVVSGQKTDLLTITATGAAPSLPSLSQAIAEARISDNGQWVVLVTEVDGKEAIQLVRADGQEVQTLYCTASGNDLFNTLSFSPDTKYLTFEEYPVYTTGSQNLVLLELASGKLHVAEQLLDTQASAIYEPIKWRGNTSLYANYSLIGVGDTRNRHKVYLLPDVTQNSTSQQISLPNIPGGTGDTCYDFDFSPDNTQLLTSDCLGSGRGYSGPSTIETVPLAGGAPHVIHTSQHTIPYARFITNTTIWFAINDYPDTGSNGLWKINIDGSGLTRLTTQGASFELLSYSSNMHISPDNTMFAIEGGGASSVAPISIGSFNGGNTSRINPTNQSSVLNLVGWTTF